MWQLFKKELKLQPWALFLLFFVAIFGSIFIPTVQHDLWNYSYTKKNAEKDDRQVLTSVSSLTDYFVNLAIKDAKEAIKEDNEQLNEDSSESSVKKNQTWRYQVKQIIVAYQEHDFRLVNRLIYQATETRPQYTKQQLYQITYLFMFDDYEDVKPQLDEFVRLNLNNTPRISGSVDNLFDSSEFFGGGLYMGQEETGTHMRAVVMIISFSLLIFAVVMTRERRQRTESFSQTLPQKQVVLISVRLILTWLLINLCIIGGLVLSTVMLHWVTGLPLGNLNFGMMIAIQHQMVYFSFLRYFITMLFFLNLWIILFAVAAYFVSLFTQSAIVTTFVLFVTFFLRQLGLLNLTPQSLRFLFPSQYTQFHRMIFFSEEYGNSSLLQITMVFVGWSLVVVCASLLVNRIKRRHYFPY